MNLEDMMWLNKLTEAKTKAEVDAASNDVLRKMHKLVVDSDFRRCDSILRCASVDNLPIQVLLAFLASTFVVRRYLVDREAFYNRVEFKLRRDEPTRSAALLRGLS